MIDPLLRRLWLSLPSALLGSLLATHAGAQSATPSCSLIETTTTCTVAAGTYTNPLQKSQATNPLTMTSDGAFNLTNPPSGYGINFLTTGTNQGPSSSNGGTGGNAGTLTVTLSGLVSLNPTMTLPTAWTSAVLLQSIGGNGGSATNKGDDGGDGGFGGFIQAANTAPITYSSPNIANGQNGSSGLDVQSIGGSGGGVDAGHTSDATGGAGGSGRAVTLTNSGAITLGTPNVLFYAYPTGLRGLSAQSLGGTPGIGGQSNKASGGNSGSATVTNSAPVGLAWSSGSGPYSNDTFFGVLARSAGATGGDGTASGASGSAGGLGSLATVNLTQGGNVALTEVEIFGRTSLAGGFLGGAVAALSEGGAGGVANEHATGGQGGTADATTVSVTDASITVAVPPPGGGQLPAIRSESVGGNGGSGLETGEQYSESSGGNGGAAGTATVNLATTVATPQVISTFALDSPAIIAASTGGSGGTGADFNPGIFGAGGAGGNGGNGAAGNQVNVSIGNNFAVSTTLPGGSTIQAASAGGHGGNGGLFGGGVTGAGGAGGAGGNGGNVTVTVGQSLVSAGVSSAAVISAISVGGRGGNGGYSGDPVNATGGAGGNGGSGADIQVTLGTGAKITAFESDTTAVWAQSSGSVGGTGGASDAIATEPGAPGNGGNSGNITIQNAGQVATLAAGSIGILAQTIAGGGGSGGDTINAFYDEATNGGAAGTVGAVVVSNTGFVGTFNALSSAIVAQSIGGGGGAGGSAGGGAISLGGNAGTSSPGGQVTATLGGTIQTQGDNSAAVILQSIGGGGGTAGAASADGLGLGGSGSAGGNGNTVTVTTATGGGITTTGNQSAALQAQSIGGGGGAGGNSNSFIALGGTGSNSGNGGAVAITADGVINTSGSQSYGIVAQSIGGGGGIGGNGMQGIVSVGGSATTSGDGSTVNMTLGGPVTTSGDLAHGVVAMSVGGGGGMAGNTTSTAALLAVAIGGTGGAGGAGGQSTITSGPGSSVTTYGSNAAGILSLSVGGGGGTGGGGYSTSYSAGFGASLAVGGSGGTGGAGGAATISLSNAHIITGYATQTPVDPASVPEDAPIPSLPISAYGVAALSAGGGGGLGASAMAKTYTADLPIPPTPGSSFAISTSFSVGGGGGVAGNGGAATVNVSNGTGILTYGTDSHAVAVQSVGGGGGDGGDASAIATTFGFKSLSRIGLPVKSTDGTFSLQARPNYNFDLALTVGGTGGSGGDGGPVQVTIGGNNLSADPLNSPPVTLQTLGDYAYGVRAQSVGGGGGNAGTGAGSTQNGTAAGTALTATITLGASGGLGGAGGNVTVDHFSGSQIGTAGDTAYGIFAESVGGGGGTSTGGSFQFGFPGLASLGLLGIGKDPATTFGNLSQIFGGIVSNVTINVGTDGAGGGNGGAVNVTSDGVVRTTGEASSGILAQSVGGGGGTAGSAGSTASSDDPTVADKAKTGKAFVNDLLAYPLDVINSASASGNLLNSLGLNLKDLFPSFNLNLSFGGTGGAAGNGGQVNVTVNNGLITTLGDYASNIEAQSVGGGGGKGGGAVAGGSSGFGNLMKISANFAIGGSGGAGGTGGDVTVALGGATMSSAGYGAYNVFAQSVGGGGDTVQSAETSETGEFSLGATISNNAAAGGDGGTVTLSQSNPNISTLSTKGDTAHAVLLQSIGGGGGVAGEGYSGAAEFLSFSTSQHTFKAGGSGAYGDGGTVQFDATDVPYLAITTSGANAYGILAQSVGGGGGLVFTNPGVKSTNLIGGGNSIAADGGSVGVVLHDGSSIATSGDGSYGILAQSVGGGGGIASYASSANGAVQLYQATSANGPGTVTTGNGGAITITTGNSIIQTTGPAAYGIFAQSIGGGGGIEAGNDGASLIAGSTGPAGSAGAGNAITINQSGTLSATGANAVGILAQSVGPNGGGIITININGQVTGGTGMQGAGVWVIGGATFSNVNIASGGSVGSAAGTSGVAVTYSGGSTLNVTNYGTMTGSVSVLKTTGNGFGTIYNYGTWNTGPAAAADVQNAGLIAIGPVGTFATTTVTGNLTQTTSGRLLIDADFNAGRADLLAVQGNAVLGGAVQVVVSTVLPHTAMPIVTVNGTITGSLAAEPSALFGYGVTQSGNQLLLSATSADFAPASFGLAPSRAAVAGHLQDIWDHGGSPALGALFALLGNTADVSPAAYSAQLRQLSPDAAFAPGARGVADAQSFANNTLSCPMFEGTTAMLVEGQCAWMRVTGRTASQDSGNGISNYNLDTATWQMGGQYEIAPNWFLGGSLAYEESWLSSSDGLTKGNGQSGFGAVTLKYQTGPWLFAASAFGGAGQFDTSRIITLPGYASVPKGNPDTANVGLLLRAAYTIGREEFYLRPNFSLSTINVRTGVYQESGGGALNLSVNSASQTTVMGTPMLEVGGRIALRDGMVLRPYVTAGVSFLSNNSWRQTGHLTSAPAGTGGFSTSVPIDPVVGRVGIGAQLYTGRLIDFRLQYDGEFSGTVAAHSGSLVASLRF